MADQEKERRRATVGEFVAEGRGGERAHVELDDGAAAGSEVVTQRAPDAQYTPGSAATEIDDGPPRGGIGVDLPAVGLRRGEARDPFRSLFGERVENR